MTDKLEHADFAKNLDSKFRIRLSESETVESELNEVSELFLSTRQERFSLIFRPASNDVFLGQGQRPFEHDVIGKLSCLLCLS